MTDEQKQLLLKLNEQFAKTLQVFNELAELGVLLDQINTAMGIQDDVAADLNKPASQS